MAVPRRLLELIDIVRDVTARRDVVAVGPFRLEVELPALATDPAPALDRLLMRATFLAPIPVGAAPEAAVRRALELAGREDQFVDLSLPDSFDLGRLPEAALPRVARLRLAAASVARLLEPELLERAGRVAAGIGGRLTLVAPAGPDDGPRTGRLLPALGQLPGPVDLELTPTTAIARASLEASFEGLRRAAVLAGVNLGVKDVGSVPGGRPLDPLAGWNVLNEGCRSLFRAHPGRCPFPFLMLRWTAAGTIRACPHPTGPAVPEQDDPWNGPSLRSVRQAFLDGQAPAACRACTLLPRVLRALSASRTMLAGALRTTALAAATPRAMNV